MVWYATGMRRLSKTAVCLTMLRHQACNNLSARLRCGGRVPRLCTLWISGRCNNAELLLTWALLRCQPDVVPVTRAQASATLSDGRVFVIGGSWSGGISGQNGTPIKNGEVRHQLSHAPTSEPSACYMAHGMVEITTLDTCFLPDVLSGQTLCPHPTSGGCHLGPTSC